MEQERIDARTRENHEARVEQRQSDLRPEYCQYRDDGCKLAVACLKCPFTHCLYDEPGGKQRYFKNQRNREIARQFRKGRKLKELAEKFGVSQRTIQRAIKGV